MYSVLVYALSRCMATRVFIVGLEWAVIMTGAGGYFVDEGGSKVKGIFE